MPAFNNLFASQGTSSVLASIVSNITKNVVRPTNAPTVSPQIDETWGGATAGFAGPDSSISPYTNYYFSGNDINVSIDGTQGNINFQKLPIISLQLDIHQPKLAIYGFWSNTFDAIARGSRQIVAAMRIASTYPNYMKNMLQEVAKERLANTNGAYANTVPLSTDDQNILNFWGGGPGTSQTGNTLNLYQEHPPFDIIVIYGQQPVSISNINAGATQEAGNNPLFVDINEQLIEPTDTNVSKRLILQACEITNMSTQYTTSGEVICEDYRLMVNDINFPS